MTQNSMVANRKHKDRLFRLFFNNPKEILSDFLRKERGLIMGSILAEFDEKEYEKVIREDGYLEGREDGMEAGIETGIRALIELARECGLSDETLVAKLMDKFKISRDKAEEYIV